MTNTLPPNADVEWLRKAAKSLLKSWRAEGREDKLTAAQFALAQDYGFASWRRLKAHIDGRPTPEQADAFLVTVGQGDLPTIRETLDQNPAWVNCIGKHPYWGGRPHPLHVAIDTNREDAFDLLIDAGADVEGRGADYDNWTPLMLALSWNRRGMINTLTNQGAAENICTALLRSDDTALDRYLAQDNWRASRMPGGSLIGLARTAYAVDQLIHAGVSPDGKDRWGADAMETLSRLGKKGRPLVAALAKHGSSPPAEVFARLGDETRLKEIAAQNKGMFQDPKVITAAVDFGHINLVRWLLENGSDVNARQNFGSQATTLHSAAWNGDVAMVQCLLEHGADTAGTDLEYKTTPLTWAEMARKITNNPDCDAVIEVLANTDR